MDKNDKDIVKIKYPKSKAIIGIIILIFLIICWILKNTNLIRNYYINYLVSIVINNSLNIVFVAVILFVLNFCEVAILKRQIDKGVEQ